MAYIIQSRNRGENGPDHYLLPAPDENNIFRWKYVPCPTPAAYWNSQIEADDFIKSFNLGDTYEAAPYVRAKKKR